MQITNVKNISEHLGNLCFGGCLEGIKHKKINFYNVTLKSIDGKKEKSSTLSFYFFYEKDLSNEFVSKAEIRYENH